MIFVADLIACSTYFGHHNHLLHLVGILFPHINDDARSKPHQNMGVPGLCLLRYKGEPELKSFFRHPQQLRSFRCLLSPEKRWRPTANHFTSGETDSLTYILCHLSPRNSTPWKACNFSVSHAVLRVLWMETVGSLPGSNAPTNKWNIIFVTISRYS